MVGSSLPEKKYNCFLIVYDDRGQYYAYIKYKWDISIDLIK